MIQVTQELGVRPDGSKIVKHFFFHNDPKDLMQKAHSYFTKQERKEAKLSHKENLRQ